MGMLIKDILDANSIHTLKTSSDPSMIRNADVAEATKNLIKAISKIELEENYRSLINQFETLIKYHPIYAHRPFYLWQVMQAGYQLMNLNLSDGDSLKSNKIKYLTAFLTILLDDISDLGRSKSVFNECVLALNGNPAQDETGLYQLLSTTSSTYHQALAQAPNFKLLEALLEDSYQKWLYSFEYSLLIQEENFRVEQTWEKHLDIIAHSGTICLAGLIDLLFVPNLSIDQAVASQEIFLRTQKLPQLCNWLTSWEREFKQGDFTSGVFTMALENHVVNWETLKTASITEIKQKIQTSEVEAHLWGEWKRLYAESQKMVKEINLPILDGYVESFSPIMFMQVASLQLQ